MLFTGPLFLLAPALLRGRTRGIFQYGALAEGMGRQFEHRWIEPASPPDPEALAAQDFSATTDLYSITANVYQMRLVPLRLIQVIPLLVVALLPFVPVVLVALPLEEILKYGAKLVM